MVESKFDITERIKGLLSLICQNNPKNIEEILEYPVRKQDIENIINNSKVLFDEFSTNHAFCTNRAHATLRLIEDAVKHTADILKDMSDLVYTLRYSPTPSDEERKKRHTKRAMLSDKFVDIHNIFEKETSPLIFEIHQKLRTQNKKAKETIKDISSNKEIEAIEEYINLFKDRSFKHLWSSIIWLIFFIVTLLFSAFYIFHLIDDMTLGNGKFAKDDYINFLDHVALRAILIAFLGYVLHFLARGYNLNKNQQIIYENKKIALQSYAYFEKSNRTDKDLHRVLLMQVTNSIFENKASGYIAKSENAEPSLKINEILDIVKNMKDTVKDN